LAWIPTILSLSAKSQVGVAIDSLETMETALDGMALAQEVAVALVGFGGGAEAGVLAHGPEAARGTWWGRCRE